MHFITAYATICIFFHNLEMINQKTLSFEILSLLWSEVCTPIGSLWALTGQCDLQLWLIIAYCNFFPFVPR